MADSDHLPGSIRTLLSEAGLISAFAMRAIRVAFQPPFELRGVVHQVYMTGCPGSIRLAIHPPVPSTGVSVPWHEAHVMLPGFVGLIEATSNERGADG